MNRIKITGLVLTLLLSFNGLAQDRQDRSDSEIVMTKSELKSFLDLVAKKKKESLKREKMNSLLRSSNYNGELPKERKKFQPYNKSELDRVNDRIDMLMQTLYFGNALSGKDNSTIITSPNSGTAQADKIAYLESQLEALKNGEAVNDVQEEKEESISPERLSYLENLLAKYKNYKKQVFFAHDSDKVSASDIEYIRDVADVLNKNPELTVLLKGYASPVGNAEYNKALSMRRAESVFDELRKKGISEDRLEASFYGEDHNTSEEGARRVDMSVVIK